MTFTYDPTNSIGQVRLLIPDRVTPGQLFEDADITAFLAMELNVVKRAAALALETAASDNAMVLKVIKLLDLTTDGAKVSDALLKRAAVLREQSGYEEDTGFDIAEQVVDNFSERERIMKQWMRGAIP